MRSVRTTFLILEGIADNQPVGLSELARRLVLPKSTVQRGLTVLAELGWIRAHGAQATRWTLGDKVRALSERVDDVGRLREVALPTLAQLSSETSETIHLSVREGNLMRLVERLDSKHALRLVKPIGTRSVLHAGSAGKCVLADLPGPEINSYLESSLAPVTVNTITDPRRLRGELEVVRARGYAVADQELTDGVVSVAACIAAQDGRPFAAISVSAPATRMPEECRSTYGTLVATAAADVEERLAV